MSDIHSDRSWQAMSLITCIMSDISRLLGVGYSETWPQRQSQLISTLQWMRMIDRDTLPEGGFLIPVICPRRALWLNKSLGDVPSWNAQVSFAVTSRHALADLLREGVTMLKLHVSTLPSWMYNTFIVTNRGGFITDRQNGQIQKVDFPTLYSING